MADVTNMPSTTIHTFLGYATSGTAYTKLVPIKDFPDLGGAPDQVEITDLDDDVQKFLLGVQSMSALEFTANYVPADYDKLVAMQDGTIRKFCVAFGETGEYGLFTWDGQLAVWVVGGGVNAAREMKISISATSKVVKNDSATFTVGDTVEPYTD
jgi:hypothetical protein